MTEDVFLNEKILIDFFLFVKQYLIQKVFYKTEIRVSKYFNQTCLIIC